MDQIEIQPIQPKDRGWITSLLTDRWGSETIIIRGQAHKANHLPGFTAMLGEKQVGLITYSIDQDACEIISLDSLVEGKGVATKLIENVIEHAKENSCKRVRVITTNDNTEALAFYQKRGFVLSVIYSNAIEKSRKMKPEIPAVGLHGIPIRDEIELEMKLK